MGVNEKLIWTESVKMGDDFRSKQYYGCKLEANRQAALTSADTDVPYGLVINKPNDGETGQILLIGRAPGVVAEQITYGQKVRIASGGKIALCEPGSDTTTYIVGTCVEGASADGEIGVFDFDFPAAARAA
jgi:hypothetical protein